MMKRQPAIKEYVRITFSAVAKILKNDLIYVGERSKLP